MRLAPFAPLAVMVAACAGATDVRVDDVLLHRSIWLSRGVTSYDARLGYPIRIDIAAGPDRSGSFFATELQPAP